MKSVWLLLLLVFASASACSTDSGTTSSSTSDLSFSEALKVSMDRIVDSDSEKKQIMEFYTELGGAKASEQRAKKACEALAEGQDIQSLSIHVPHLDKPFEAVGLTPPYSNTDWETRKTIGALYQAEVYTAQVIFCPETKVELEF